MKKNHIVILQFIIFSVFIILISACEANTSTGSSGGDDVLSSATASAEVKDITYKTINRSIVLSWTAPTLSASHKSKDGKALTKADISYKVFIVEKGAKSRTVANIIALDKAPLKVRKGITTINIDNRKLDTTYEIVVQAVNATDTTKVSTGMRVEVTVLNPSTTPADARNVRGSPTDTSARITWQEPTLDDSHKKADGTQLTTADLSYKVYHVAKGIDARTVANIIIADTNPLEVAKGTTTSANITNLTPNTTYEIVVQAVNSTDTTKVSTGIRIEVTTLVNNQATAPAEARSVRGSSADDSVAVSWQEPALTSSHKKADGQALTTADVFYKVYRVVKGAESRTIAEIKAADITPLEVTKGTTSTTINNLTGSTTYEIVVQAVNSTDSAKASTGKRIEVTTTNPATAPAEASSVAGSPTDTSARITWQAPTLTSNHKKANGQRLTTADVSYKVYRVAKGSDARTIAEIKTADTTPLAVAKGTTSTNITNLKLNTTYEIVVQAVNSTDTTKVSTGKRIEVTTLANNHATAPAEASSVAGSPADDSVAVSWQAPNLTSSHKKANGTQLTTAEVFYKVYRVVKGAKSKTVAEIKAADNNPQEVAKGTTSTSINNLTGSTTYEMVVQAVNSTDPTKASTGVRIEVTTTNPATAPAEAGSVTAGSSTDTSARITWQVPTLDDSHKKANGQALTKADVSYKVYRVAKGSNARTIAEIKTADNNPIAVAKGARSTNITNLTPNTTYEIVVQAVNSTDTTKVSTGKRIEVTTTNPATAPAEVSSVAGSSTDTSVEVSWQAPALTSSHKKTNGQRLTILDVSYKVYRVAKGSDARTIAEIKTADTTPLAVAKGTTNITITNLKPTTTYEIVVQAVNSTDTTKVSTGIRIEVTTLATNHATAPAEASSVAGSPTDTSVGVSWTAPTLDDSHKKANGQALTTAEVSYKVYRVAKGNDARTIAEIKTADKIPLAVAKGTTNITITNLKPTTTYEIVVQAVNSTDMTKVSTGIRTEVSTLANNQATAPAEARSVRGSPADDSVGVSWTAPTLDDSHKKANGQALTTAEVSYKVYRVAKGSDARTIAEIKTADVTPLSVGKGTTSTTINNLIGSTTYEIVVQAVNSTDTTKVSTGKRIEVTTTNPATAPADARNVRGSPADTSARITWQEPALTSSHKKANGQRLATADISYKVYWVAKGKNDRTVAEIKAADLTPLAVAKGTTSTSITNLIPITTYEIVVQAVNTTDITKVSPGARIEVTTTNSATAPPEASFVVGGLNDDGSVDVSWQEPALTSSHKKANGQRLTTADVSYKVYRVEKISFFRRRTIAEIKTADNNPLAVAKGTTSINITNLKPNVTYEIVVQAINSTDTTKVSTGVRAEVTVTNHATAPPDTRGVNILKTDTSVILYLTVLPTDSHKKRNGQRLTTADISYKVYRVVKGKNARTLAQIKAADPNPQEVAKGTTNITITNLTENTTYEIVVQSVNATDTTKVSTGKRIEVTTTNYATPPAEARSVTGSPTDDSITVLWIAPTLDDSHKKTDGQALTAADVSYKVYRVVKGAKNRTVAEIKAADLTPLAVAKGTTSTSITNLAGSTTYEIVLQAVNSTASTKVSTGVRIEKTTTNPANAPPEASSFIRSSTDTSMGLSWDISLRASHKKTNGQRLTKADVSYKVYYVAKGRNARTVAEIKTADNNPIAITKGTTSTNITNLSPATTYEIVVQAINSTDLTKTSTGMRIEITTTNQASVPAEPRSVTAGSTTGTSTTISWTAPALTISHKKADGTQLTSSDISYKVYQVAKGSNARTIAQIKTADRTPLTVAKGTTSINIANLTPYTTYEIVVQAVNSTNTTKTSTGIRKEVTTLSLATPPPEAGFITPRSFSTYIRMSWYAPDNFDFTSSHKKADGTQLTTSDVSYKIYRVAKGSNARTIAQIKTADRSPIAVKGTEGVTSVVGTIFNKDITNLFGNTTYEIVVQTVNATDPTRVSTGTRIEVTTLSAGTPPDSPSWRSVKVSPARTSTLVSWKAAPITHLHRKADGTQLTAADVSYKVYRVVRGKHAKSIAQVKAEDKNPLVVAKGTSVNITNLKPDTFYAIVIQAVNSTDPTKVSVGIYREFTTTR